MTLREKLSVPEYYKLIKMRNNTKTVVGGKTNKASRSSNSHTDEADRERSAQQIAYMEVALTS